MTTIQNCTSCHLDGRVYYMSASAAVRAAGLAGRTCPTQLHTSYSSSIEYSTCTHALALHCTRHCTTVHDIYTTYGTSHIL
jgi:hypothetical protein